MDLLQMANVVLSMSLPDWNTHNAFLTENTRTFATTPELAIEGTYRFYANANPANVERLAIAVKVSSRTARRARGRLLTSR